MNERNVLRYLRITGEPDDRTRELIGECDREAKMKIEPKRVYRVYDIVREENGISLDGVLFEGEQIVHRLVGFEQCAVFAVTLGIGADLLVRRYTSIQPSKAAVMHAVLADMTESVCDLTEAQIRKGPPAYETGTRFSPGYPGLPLDYQPLIFRMLEVTKRIGISLTEQNFMIPHKSVTAFLGVKEKNYEQVSGVVGKKNFVF
ncbi:MAG: Vitamin B12 dependent methionine synthase activation subunit [Clostridia bacterium]|nr:Vitamin B12 dependent methionine synthase activation subunit [Clostridia bacterium]